VSVRVLLSLVLAFVLLAASMPAIEDARTVRSERHVETVLSSVDRAATGLATVEEPTAGAGARRVITVRLPLETWSTRRVEWLAIGGRPGKPNPRLLTYKVAGRPVETEVLSIPVHTVDGPLVLDGPGTHRLVLTLDGADDGVAVVAVRGDV
jgi:hypothetical protein